QQIVVAVAFVEMRPFGEAQRRAFEDQVASPDELAFTCGIFLQDDAGKAVAARTIIPEHIEQILSPVRVVEERRIKPAAVEINRVRPIAVDAWAGHKVVVKVSERRARRTANGGAAV